MKEGGMLIKSDSIVAPADLVCKPSWVMDYVTLVKPEVTFLVLIATGLGCAMASNSVNLLLLFHALMGTALVAGGTATLNHYVERSHDAKMRRTANRPLPAGRLTPEEVFRFGASLSVGGLLYLAFIVNVLTSLIGLATLLSYLLIYTPLKRQTSLCTFIGAFPGAAPALMGWAAVRNNLALEAWVLYSILFLWQFPHFLAIAWMYREDYARAGMLMLPERDTKGDATFRRILACSLALIPVSLIPSFAGMAGNLYLVSALVLGLVFSYFAYYASLQRTKVQARLLVHATVIYLPLLYAAMVMNKAPF
jgi:protoheme IX farnesyltransferase